MFYSYYQTGTLFISTIHLFQDYVQWPIVMVNFHYLRSKAQGHTVLPSKSPSQRQKTKGQWDGSESPGTCCQAWRTEFEGGNHLFRRKWIPTNCLLLHTHNGTHMPTINIFIPSNTNISINWNKLPTYFWGAEWKDNYRIELRNKMKKQRPMNTVPFLKPGNLLLSQPPQDTGEVKCSPLFWVCLCVFGFGNLGFFVCVWCVFV